jgi:hypothetical protein
MKKPAKKRRPVKPAKRARMLSVSEISFRKMLIEFHGCFAKTLCIHHITLEQMRDRINENNERLRVIEADIEKITKYVGAIACKKSTEPAPVHVPLWKSTVSAHVVKPWDVQFHKL